jgi:hypothetical protein
MLALALVLSLAQAQTLFEDTQHRFTLELPPKWSFAPQAGNIHGASFRVIRDQNMAHFSIQILPCSPSLTIKRLKKRVLGQITQREDYRVLSTKVDKVAGLEMWTQRYRLKVPELKGVHKVVEKRFGIYKNHAYVIHMESLENASAIFIADFNALLKSLRLSNIDLNSYDPQPKTFVGTWHMSANPSVFFHLRRDGTFQLDDVVGVWRVEAGEFWSRPLGGGAERFSFTSVDDRLTLHNASLEAPIVYRRVALLQGPNLEPLLASWHNAGHRLILKRDGRCNHQGVEGLFHATASHLFLTLARQKTQQVGYQIKKRRLTVTGGVFKAKTTLTKAPHSTSY